MLGTPGSARKRFRVTSGRGRLRQTPIVGGAGTELGLVATPGGAIHLVTRRQPNDVVLRDRFLVEPPWVFPPQAPHTDRVAQTVRGEVS